MLRPDKAEKELEKYKSEVHFNARLARLKKLPMPQRAIGCLILDRTPEGKPFNNWQQMNKLKRGLHARLAKLPDKARRELFAALFPKLAGSLEAAWHLFPTLPYQTGYSRKSFRAPKHTAAANTRRLNWLVETTERLREYDPDIEWLATWAGYLSYGSSDDNSGYTLAAAINKGGADAALVLDILKQSASNQHAIGAMGRHVTRALMVCDNPDAWEFVEKFLLAAQRQEGLRQVILEAIDEAHPQAFRRMLRLIKDKELVRFSATVRAVNVWFGFLWDSVSIGTVNKVIDAVTTYLDDDAARKEALAGGDGEQVYLALWSLAFDDVDKAVAAAGPVLAKGKTEARFAAITLLRHLSCPLSQKHFLAAMDDADLHVALEAFEGASRTIPAADPDDDDDESEWTPLPVKDMFERAEKLVARLPEKPQKLKALVWPWTETAAGKEQVAASLPNLLGKRDVMRLLPYLPFLRGWQKSHAIDTMVKRKPLDERVRDMLFTLVRDNTSYVREKAVDEIAKIKLEPGEPEKLELALTRSNSNLRKSVLTVLMKQKEAAIDESAERLLTSQNKNQRFAGLDLLISLADSGRQANARRARGVKYETDRGGRISEDETDKLVTLAKTVLPKPTLDDGLGLLNPAGMTKPVPPEKHDGFLFMSDAAANVIKALDKLIHEHREHTYQSDFGDKTEERLLGTFGFPAWNEKKTHKQNLARLPLRKVWEEWYASRPKNQRDKDGMELLRAERWVQAYWSEWNIRAWKDVAASSPGMKAAFNAVTGGHIGLQAQYHGPVLELLGWLRTMYPESGVLRWQIDATEASFALVPRREFERGPKDKDFRDWRSMDLFTMWAENPGELATEDGWTPALARRYWGLMRWKEESIPKARRERTDPAALMLAYRHGAATTDDLIDALIGPRKKVETSGYYYSYHNDFETLGQFTRRKPDDATAKFLADFPDAKAIVERVKARVLEVELDRTELDTAATKPAGQINSLTGTDVLFKLFRKLGRRKLERSAYGSGYSAVFTNLIKVTHPGPADTPEQFAELAKALVKEGKVPAERFLDLVFAAPQWLPHAAPFFGWPGFEEAVYWFQAHDPNASHYDPDDGEIVAADDDDDDDYDSDIDDEGDGATAAPAQPAAPKTAWEKLLAERTTLTSEDRNEGAVDAAWFWRAFEPLGSKKWDALAAAAKYASGYGGGHKKALFLSQVLRGKAKKRDLVKGIRERQLKESVRCLGLLPLATGARREQDLMSRYKVLQGFLRYARSLGPMSREATVRAGQIGLENLARTAGYADPIRLEWAMEAKSIADLQAGPISRTAGGVTVTLSLIEGGLPETTFKRGDKPLKSLPSVVRKDRKVAELMDRKADLRRQASRMKWSLESAMIRGDTFTGTELRTLFEHPMLEPLLSRLVLIGEGITGYPVKGGRGLEDHAGKVEPVKADEKLRIAHCHDLYAAGDWHQWQSEAFRRERIQPFKQVFRELYLVTEAEAADQDQSMRYGGQQVNPSQANALWGGRGWGTKDEVRRRFHEAGVTAEVYFRSGYGTPLEVEGLTLDAIRFYRKSDGHVMNLKDVPPRVFSEVMRDCDLVVSVAHRGGVDPEASQSTVEMRAALLRETCQLLKMPNVRIKGNHILIDGELNNYSVHLGSAVVHRVPGGSVCIIPVPAGHRGRIFLPFADEDPKTAEVITKTIMLARDAEIQDPGILDQLRMK